MYNHKDFSFSRMCRTRWAFNAPSWHPDAFCSLSTELLKVVRLDKLQRSKHWRTTRFYRSELSWCLFQKGLECSCQFKSKRWVDETIYLLGRIRERGFFFRTAIVSGYLVFTLFRTPEGGVTWKKVSSSKAGWSVMVPITPEIYWGIDLSGFFLKKINSHNTIFFLKFALLWRKSTHF